MLHVLGEPVAVLDGSLQAWPGPLETDDPRYRPVERPSRPWPADRFVSADELAASGAIVYDARTAERYARGDAAIDPRPGHIPGALSAHWGGNLDADGRFRPAAELQARFEAAGSRKAIAYCGSGVTACHNLLALTVAGAPDIALYPGSWSQWGADPSRPAETSGVP
jgi:thiosulfate/3-mercaptopyruvate sulfurtransferase